MVTLTIFTPAYNRAHTIKRTYKSLCEQTNHDFGWLVVDDGSTDNTRNIICSLISDVEVISDTEFYGHSIDSPWLQVHYIYQRNQGMHGAHNTAYNAINTELNTCIDSDDYMPCDAVEKILGCWESLSAEDKSKYAGIVALDVADQTLDIIGDVLPTNKKSITINGYYDQGGRGDKKLIYRTEVIKSVPPYPLFEGEKYVGLGYKYRLIDQQYELLILNEPVCIVEYQLDGSSHGMYKQYWNNPKGWMFTRKFEMPYIKDWKRKVLVCAHYVFCCIRCKKVNVLSDSPNKFLTFLTIPLGCIMYAYIWYKVKYNKNFKF